MSDLKVGDYVYICDVAPYPANDKTMVWRIRRLESDISTCISGGFSRSFRNEFLVKTLYKPGDEVSFVDKNNRRIESVVEAIIMDQGRYPRYRLKGVEDPKMAQELEEVKHDFGIGDFVYVNHDRAENKRYCYELFTVTGIDGYVVECKNKQNNSIRFDGAYLKKPAFEIGQRIPCFGDTWMISEIYFFSESLYYTITAEGKIQNITESSLLEQVPNIIRKNGNENQLQRETNPERRDSDQGQGRIYGRKPNVTIKVKPLSYKAITVRGKRQTEGSQDRISS